MLKDLLKFVSEGTTNQCWTNHYLTQQWPIPLTYIHIHIHKHIHIHIQWNLYKETEKVLLKHTNFIIYLALSLQNHVYSPLPAMKEHLPWETTEFSGHLIQVSLHTHTHTYIYIYNSTTINLRCHYDLDIKTSEVETIRARCQRKMTWQDSTINSLRPGDTIWRHRSGSTLTQVMACCLTAPSHYLN